MKSHATTYPSPEQARREAIAYSAVTGVRAIEDRRPSPGLIGGFVRRAAISAAPGSTLLVRAVVGAVFLLEGTLKFVDPQGLGAGRFATIGIPYPGFFAPFDGAFEIACGLGLMLGLLTRLAAIPMIVNMLVAIATTKIPMLLHAGFWKAAHEARLDFSMLLACVFLLLAGGGPLSLDSLLLAPSPNPREEEEPWTYGW